ncbi:hypothetical protein CIK05_09120 [Bdellovibrio sp. qaytius]|nr:hypothetical protein CIK05_09120 [Bdellovibrio sp. qaytius]
MFAVEIMMFLVVIGGVMAALLPLRAKYGQYSWIISLIFTILAIAIFVFTIFKHEKFVKWFSHRFATTISITVVLVLLMIAYVLLPRAWIT